MEEYKDQKDESWIVVKYFVKLTTWLTAMKPDQRSDTEENIEKTVEELLDDWEWVRSPKEELAIKISYENALRIGRELKELQSTASSIKLRQYFFRKCSRFMAGLSVEERELLQTVLDAPKRSAIIKLAIKNLEQPWLEFIREKFFLRPASTLTTATYSSPCSSTEIELPFLMDPVMELEEETTPDISPEVSPSSSPSNSPPSWPPQTFHTATTLNSPLTTVSGSWEIFANSYQEQSYEKNIAGSMASVGFQASHGAIGDHGLTSRILGDIIWSVFSTLSHAICQTLKRDFLSAQEMKALARRVLQMKDPLVDLWIQTIKNSRIGSKNEGRLIAKWKQEEEQHKQRLQDIKRRGADARFYDEERQTRMAVVAKKRRMRGEDPLEEEDSVDDAQTNGVLIIEDYQPHPKRDDFIRAKQLLEATLFGRTSLPVAPIKQDEKTRPKLRVKIDMTGSTSFASPLNIPSRELSSSTIQPTCSLSPSLQRLSDSFFVC